MLSPFGAQPGLQSVTAPSGHYQDPERQGERLQCQESSWGAGWATGKGEDRQMQLALTCMGPPEAHRVRQSGRPWAADYFIKLAVVSCTRELTLPPLLSGQYRTPLEREISVSVSLTAEE